MLSGVRLRLGVGIGWNQVEYQALGVPFRQRGALLEEQVDVLRKLWADPATIGIEARLSLGAVPEQDWRAYADGWRELGATHLCVNTMNMGLSKPEDHAAVLRDVLPKLT